MVSARVSSVLNGNIDSIRQRKGKVNKPVQRAIGFLKDRTNLLSALGGPQSLAGWDEEVYMPKGAVNGRAWAMGIAAQHGHDLFTDNKVGTNLKKVEESGQLENLSLAEQRFIELLRRGYDKSTKLPSSFVREQSEVLTKAQQAWKEAKGKNDFSIFAPHLKKVVELARKAVAYLNPTSSNPYDVLLDNYELGMTSAKLESIFGPLRDQTVQLLRAIQEKGVQRPSGIIGINYPKQKQFKVAHDLLRVIGYDFNRGRLDLSAHPFTIEIGGPHDVRVTTRILQDNPFSNIGSAMHEGGHGIHGQQISGELVQESLSGSPSLGISESQSRFFENLVGKNRAFWEFYYPKLQKAFPTQLKDVSLDDFYLAMNYVEPSLIRVEADELTYNLHIIVRWELEKALMEGNLSVDDAPTAWEEKMEEYVGVRPNNVRDGILQDVHWSQGYFGYFPTYSIGNLIAPQLQHAAQKELGDLDELLRNGDITPIREWLGKHVHWYGDMLTPDEVVKGVTGESLNPDYSANYMRAKFSSIYNL